MKKISIILSIMFLVTIIVACASEPLPISEATEIEILEQEVMLEIKEEPTPEPMLEPTQTPGSVSYMTGLPVDDDYIYKPLGVMIENSLASRPQYGLQYADIVYEAPVEGCTRFFCLFNDTLPEVVGPIRSARIYYIKIQQEWDSAYVHFGGADSGEANCYDEDSDHIKIRLDFIKGKYNDYYWRDSKFKAPHNAFTNLTKCQEVMDYEPEPRPFNYDDSKVYSGQTVSNVIMPFYSGTVTYKYDDNNDVFVRYMKDKEFKDATTNEAIKVKNIIVQYTNFYHGNEVSGRWLCDQLGEGKAEFFIGGKHILGTWERAGYNNPTIYKDETGEEIVLKPGNTWIALHPNSKEIAVQYK